MSTSSARKSKQLHIYKTAGQLFLASGYEKTSMRGIADACGVSLGLITYHFAEKKNIAFKLISNELSAISEIVEKYAPLEEDAALHSGCITKLFWTVFSSPKFFNFYLDVLKEDIYLNVVLNSGIGTFKKICEQKNLSHNDQYLQLYGNYISVSLERTLVLYCREDNYLNDSIPNLIFNAYMGRIWGTQEQLNDYCIKTSEIVDKISTEHPEVFEGWYETECL